MCLGLVAIVSQQGLPVLPALPLPGVAPEPSGRAHDARAIAAPSRSPNLELAVEAPLAGSAARGARAKPEQSGSSDLSGSQQLATVQDPVPAEDGDDGAPSDPPVAASPAATPPSEAPTTVVAPDPAPAASTGVGASPGKATAVVDPSGEDESNAQDGVDKAEEERSARGGQKGGRPVRSEPPPPSPVQAEDEEVRDHGSDAADVPPSQAEAAEDRARGSRGHRRFGR